ncbi:MAG: Na+/H+ antiporter NhaC family protein [Planctomycetota bacterium]
MKATQTSKRQFAMPPALVILVVVLLMAAIATLVLPRGEFERVEKRFPNLVSYSVAEGDTLQRISEVTGADLQSLDQLRSRSGETQVTRLVPGELVLVPVGGLTREAVIPGSYRRLGSEQGLGRRALSAASNVLLAPIYGFVDKAQIIGFVLLLGGAFGVILSTGAIDQGLAWVVMRIGQGPAKWAVIPVSFTLFSLGGAVFGLGETTIAFVLITVPLSLRLGYDTITGVAMCYLASQVGFAGAFFNPFTVGIAQGIAELPYLSGLFLRYIVWFCLTLVGIAFTMVWARRVERDPSRSPTQALDAAQRGEWAATEQSSAERPSVGQWIVVAVALGSVFVSGFGVAQWGWYIDEMAALFVVCSVVCGLLTRFSAQRMSDEFVRGAKLMVEPALIIACSAGIVMVLQRGKVLDTILHGLATPLETVSTDWGATALMMVQAMLNFFVPSGSGQAAMTMPIVTPLCDLIGLDRQVGVLAFQFGDGFGNVIVPTSAVLMGVLGASKIPWTTWVRWVAPLVIVLHLMGAGFLILANRLPIEWLQ